MFRGGSCASCAAPLSHDFRFCPGCGQKSAAGRLSLHDIVHDVVHAIFHADTSILRLIKELALRPGVVAREYALEGKRKRYFNPFAFLVLMLGAAVTVNPLVHPYTPQAHPVPADVEPALRALFERQDRANLLLERYANIVTFASLPIFSFVSWLFFRKRNVRFAEVLVGQVFFVGFLAGLFAVGLTPFAHWFPNPLAYNLTRIGIELAYLSLANRQFFRLEGALSYLKSAFASVFAFAVWAVLSMTVMYGYIRYG